jgi:hypothetical protein
MVIIKERDIMDIVKTKDPNIIKFIGERINKFIVDNDVKDYTADTFINWLRVSVTSPYVCVVVAKEEDNVIGYCVCTIIQTFGGERLEIVQFAGDTEETEKELFSYVQNWSKELFIKRISIMTKFPKKWKDFGFELTTHVLSMGV